MVRVTERSGLTAAVDQLGLETGRPVIVVVGGAGGISSDEEGRLRPLFDGVLVPVAQALGATVVDGGTASGVMRLMGESRASIGATFPLVGVCAEGTIATAGDGEGPDGQALLESHHTHFVVVPGDRWGDESRWLSEVAGLIANGKPSATVLIDGGDIALSDVLASVRARRPVLAIGGTGRTADDLAGSGNSDDERTHEVIGSGLLHRIAAETSAKTLETLLGSILQVEVDDG